MKSAIRWWKGSGAERISAGLVPLGLALASLLVGASVDAASAEPAATHSVDRRQEAPRIYRGAPPRRIRSTSRIHQAATRHAFEPALQGDVLEHTFLIANDQESPMEILRPSMCSGCMLESWSKEIAPGERGRISIVIPTDALGGQEIASPIHARTSSSRLGEIRIDVSLIVREFARLSPYRVWLEGAVGERIVERCIVVPNEAYPFAITGLKARKGTWFTWAHEPTWVDGRPGFEITLENTRTKPGPYQDVLFIQTDHPERPEIRLRIEGRIGE